MLAGSARYRLAKTNGVTFVMDEDCDVPPRTEAKLLIIVDGQESYKRVFLPDGVTPGLKRVRYEDGTPF